MSATRILIIADAWKTVDDFRVFFDLHGYETEVVLNIEASLSILETRRMDMAIIGFEVQNRSGIDVLAKVRAIDPLIPAIIHGSNSKRIKSMIKKADVQAYITKPIKWDSFLRKVKKILASHVSKVA
tara:strand:- start:751 stop:1131 length:381 start_codon:yes stop_codon:yes gene_type:complete